MSNVVYDCLNYTAVVEGDVFVENYEGFLVEENQLGDTYFVVYKEIQKDNDVERKYAIDANDFSTFMDLTKRYENIFEKQKFLHRSLKQMEQINKAINVSSDALKNLCDSFYEKPENYIHFVAMNMVKSKYFLMAKEQLEKPLAS